MNIFRLEMLTTFPTSSRLSTLHKCYLLPELPEERLQVRLCLRVGCTGQLPLHTALHVVLPAVQIFGPNTKKKLEPNRNWCYIIKECNGGGKLLCNNYSVFRLPTSNKRISYLCVFNNNSSILAQKRKMSSYNKPQHESQLYLVSISSIYISLPYPQKLVNDILVSVVISFAQSIAKSLGESYDQRKT